MKTKNNKQFALVVNLLAIALLVTGGYGIKYVLDQQRDIKEAEEQRQELLLSQQKKAKELKEQLLAEKNKKNSYRDFDSLKKKNPDTVAWIIVPGADVDMPIVKADDNKYYLTHNYEREYNSMGWAFADSKNTFPNLSDNTIMYGHTYKSTAIFSKLKNVLEKDWLNDVAKQIITFDTEKERLTFKVFSIYTTEATNDYLKLNFKTKDDFKKYLDRETKRSIKYFKVRTNSNDKIITLSTCYIDANHRLVIHAKLIGSE